MIKSTEISQQHLQSANCPRLLFCGGNREHVGRSNVGGGCLSFRHQKRGVCYEEILKHPSCKVGTPAVISKGSNSISFFNCRGPPCGVVFRLVTSCKIIQIFGQTIPPQKSVCLLLVVESWVSFLTWFGGSILVRISFGISGIRRS